MPARLLAICCWRIMVEYKMEWNATSGGRQSRSTIDLVSWYRSMIWSKLWIFMGPATIPVSGPEC